MLSLGIVTLVNYVFCLVLGQIDIRLPPSITKGPAKLNFIYRSDDSVTLDCKGQGVPSVTYDWRKNGFELNQNLLNIHKGEDGTITIQPATSMDEGFYQCFARNQYGTALSIRAHIRRALLDSASGTSTVLQKTVYEGMPFHIQADPRKSFPKPTYGWEMAVDTVDKNPTPLRPSKRIQIAENGDLYFGYALPEDALGGRLYKSTTYNPYLDVKAGGSYTQLNVVPSPGGVSQFAPTLGFASEVKTVAVIGESVTLRCFFSGFSEPTMSWSGPRNTLPIGRYSLNTFNTELTINNITASDEGDYVCTAFNTQGRNTHTLQIRVEEAPVFRAVNDGPINVNVTEGDSFTFSCNVNAKPEATIIWLQNGEVLDPENPPKRFAFSSNRKSLTIRDVCRNCEDRDKQTDLTVIQCNASNVHGYAFASGYLNVLLKTKVTIRGSKNVSVDFLEEKQFVFQCQATSDPSTPTTVRWYNPLGDLVRDEPPYIYVTKNLLIIMIHSNCSAECAKYRGEYRCVGDNRYSQGNSTITISFRPSTEAVIEKEESGAAWKIILGAGAIGLFLLLIVVFFGFRLKRKFGVVNIQTTKRRLPYPPNMYDRVGYYSVGLPLEATSNNGESNPQAYSMYDCIGYDSMDHILEEMTARERAMPQSPHVHEYHKYESIDEPQTEVTKKGRRMLDKDTKHDVTDYSKPLEEVKSRRKIDHHQVHGVEAVTSESEHFPLSNEQSESTNPYLDLDVNPYLDLSPKEMNPYMELDPKEWNSSLALVSKEANPYLDLVSKEMNPYLDMSAKSVNLSLDLSPKEINHNLDLVSNEINPNSDLVSNEINPNSDLVLKEVNPNLNLVSEEVNPNLDLVSKEVYPNLDLVSKEAKPYVRSCFRRIEPHLDMFPK